MRATPDGRLRPGRPERARAFTDVATIFSNPPLVHDLREGFHDERQRTRADTTSPNPKRDNPAPHGGPALFV